MTLNLRLATLLDSVPIAMIEKKAAERFDPSDLPPGRAQETLDSTVLARSISDHLTWVAVDPDAGMVGFLAATKIHSALHILEMSVLPAHGRRGVGSSLLGTAAQAAMESKCSHLTLTTFSHVPWNRPFYERHGFAAASVDLLPHLAECLHSEQLSGLKNRVAMCRKII